MVTLEWVSCFARKFFIRQLMVYSIYPMQLKLWFFKTGDTVPLNFRKSVWLCVRGGEGGPAEGTKRHCSRQGGHGSQGIDQEWAGRHWNVILSFCQFFPRISPIFMCAVRNRQFNMQTLQKHSLATGSCRVLRYDWILTQAANHLLCCRKNLCCFFSLCDRFSNQFRVNIILGGLVTFLFYHWRKQHLYKTLMWQTYNFLFDIKTFACFAFIQKSILITLAICNSIQL